jgi:uncharacterized coiled-coil protein SlyX
LYNESVREWETYINVCTALKNHIIQSIEDVYLLAMNDPYLAYANVTIKEMINYLFEQYGNIDSKALGENEKKMQQPWNPDTPFETVIKQINDAVAFADAGGEPIQAKRILRTAYSIVYDTGLYYETLEKWDDKPAADKTWKNFQTHMNIAKTKMDKRCQADKAAGYHNANHIAEEDLINIVCSATQRPLEDITNLLRMMQATINTQQQKIDTQQQKLDSQQEKLSALEHANKAEENKGSKPPGERKKRKDHGTYCWTHGYAVGKNHTSATCTNPADGHQKEATRSNTMGGSTKGKKALGL